MLDSGQVDIPVTIMVYYVIGVVTNCIVQLAQYGGIIPHKWG